MSEKEPKEPKPEPKEPKQEPIFPKNPPSSEPPPEKKEKAGITDEMMNALNSLKADITDIKTKLSPEIPPAPPVKTEKEPKFFDEWDVL